MYNYIAMHGAKNIKEKLYKTNAAVWYKKKTCRQKQLTPNFISFNINVTNRQGLNAAEDIKIKN